MTVTVRRARTTDATALAQLAEATFPLACPPGSAREDIAEFIATHLSTRSFSDYLADDGRRILVAEDDDGCVATRCSSPVSRWTPTSRHR